jgi:hypothetical protein
MSFSKNGTIVLSKQSLSPLVQQRLPFFIGISEHATPMFFKLSNAQNTIGGEDKFGMVCISLGYTVVFGCYD